MPEQKTTAIPGEAKAVLRLAIWTGVWIASLALARFGPDVLWGGQSVISWIAVGVNVLAGIAWIVAHARFLRSVDDLQRKIMLDAIAVALGVGLVGGFAYAAANSAGLVDFDSGIAVMSVVMAVVYVLGILVGNLRYR